MEAVTLIIAVVALVVAVVAFVRSGGVRDVRNRVDVIGSKAESARDRTADALNRLERLIRGKEKAEPEKEEESGESSTPTDRQ